MKFGLKGLFAFLAVASLIFFVSAIIPVTERQTKLVEGILTGWPPTFVTRDLPAGVDPEAVVGTTTTVPFQRAPRFSEFALRAAIGAAFVAFVCLTVAYLFRRNLSEFRLRSYLRPEQGDDQS